MLELVDSLILSLTDVNRKRSSRFSDKIVYNRGYSLIGKTTILHIVISGSSPDVSNFYVLKTYIIKAWEAQLVERNIEAV